MARITNIEYAIEHLQPKYGFTPRARLAAHACVLRNLKHGLQYKPAIEVVAEALADLCEVIADNSNG